MNFIKNIGMYLLLAAIVFGIRLLSATLITKFEKNVNHYKETSGKVPFGSLLGYFLFSYISLFLMIFLCSIPVLFIFSSWEKVFAVVLILAIIASTIFAHICTNSIIKDFAINTPKIKASIIVYYLLNQILVNIALTVAISPLKVTFMLPESIYGRIHDYIWIAVFILNVVLMIIYCKLNAKNPDEK